MERYNKSNLERIIDLENKLDKLILSGVVKSLPCKKCNDNGGFATMEGWETCTNCL